MTADAIPTLAIVRTCPYAPPAQHRSFRQEAPITKVELPTGATAWAVTRHEDIRTLLSDPRFSASRKNPGFPHLSPLVIPALNGKPLLIEMDGQEHAAARRAVVGEFTVKRAAALAPRIQQIVDEHIDAMLAGPRPVDLVQALSLPVPSLVICELLGVPYADHGFFQARSATLVSREAPLEAKGLAFFELLSYLDKLVTDKEQNPTDDLLGRQVLKLREEGTYDHESLLNLSFILLIAGHETTANMISLSTLALLKHPEKLAALRQDPEKTLAAVEELLRYFTIAELGVGRVATEDVELGGVLIRAGEGVVVLANIGNRDPEVFQNADELDLQRGARNHVAFGFGAHQCLGQNLARIELQIVLDTLFRRIPELRLAVPEEELPFKSDALVYGLHELPVTW
ncbi:cytochrome P450 [Polyangium mundeleinium]|uniref:Cytochrome P450 n=1 Tax=Polyangium mundeleinium TaxID=2995306 RepID=A0ABT5F377_9BACT|nr:cytochrome P450 [Polyangium mundeleinium]MDC0747597.1 cytochrome P450 [Polyangium mundeleinium]